MTERIIRLDEDLIEELYRSRPGFISSDWEFVEKQYHWDGSEDRTKTVIVKNIKEDYLLSISNGYDSWDSYWDPEISVVTKEEILVKVNQYNIVSDIIVTT